MRLRSVRLFCLLARVRFLLATVLLGEWWVVVGFFQRESCSVAAVSTDMLQRSKGKRINKQFTGLVKEELLLLPVGRSWRNRSIESGGVQMNS